MYLCKQKHILNYDDTVIPSSMTTKKREICCPQRNVLGRTFIWIKIFITQPCISLEQIFGVFMPFVVFWIFQKVNTVVFMTHKMHFSTQLYQCLVVGNQYFRRYLSSLGPPTNLQKAMCVIWYPVCVLDTQQNIFFFSLPLRTVFKNVRLQLSTLTAVDLTYRLFLLSCMYFCLLLAINHLSVQLYIVPVPWK